MTALVPLMMVSSTTIDAVSTLADLSVFASLRGVQEARAAALFVTLREDRSAMRVRAEDARLLEMCEIAVSAMGSGEEEPSGGAKSAWKALLGFCSWAGVLPWRTEAAAALGSSEAARQRETVIWINALIYIYPRMKPAPGRTTHPKPSSAMAILQHVRRLHERLDIPVVSLKPCVRAMRRLIDEWVDEHGVEALQPQRKAALTPELIIRLVAATHGDPMLSPADAAVWAAMWHLLAQTGFRKAEVAIPEGVRHGARHLSWDNIKWCIGGKDYAALTPPLFNVMGAGDVLIVRPPPSKADPWGLRWGVSPVYLPYSATAPICAARAMAALEIQCAPAVGKRSVTPLFATAGGQPLRRAAVSRQFDRWMAGIVADNPKRYSVHSFRIFLATALAAQGASDARIQSMLRWASVDELN